MARAGRIVGYGRLNQIAPGPKKGLDGERISIYLIIRYIETHSENQCPIGYPTTTAANVLPGTIMITNPTAANASPGKTITTAITVAAAGTAEADGPIQPTLRCVASSRMATYAWSSCG